MRKIITVVFTVKMLTATLSYAGNGDLIVNGNLGVGTTTPRAKFEINYTPISAPWNAFIFESRNLVGETGVANLAIRVPYAYWNGGGYNDVSGYLDLIKTIGGNTILATRNTDGSSLGNVGIGTTTPSANLHLKGANSAYSTLAIESSGGAGNGYGAILDLKNTDGAVAELRLSDSGSGTAYYAESNMLSMAVPSGYGIKLNTNGINNNGIRILQNGYVGIGTANPAYALDVSGTIRGSNVSPSDAKFKKNLLPIANPLDKVLGLNGHSYEWKTSEYNEKNFPDGRHYGVIAQEIEKVLPEVVNTDGKGEKSVAYTEIIPVLIEAIKEQQKNIRKQDQRISELEGMITKLTK